MPPSRAKANIMRELEVWNLLVVRLNFRIGMRSNCMSLGVSRGTNQTEETAMPYAEHDENHEHQSTTFAARIRQDFQHW